MTPQLRRPGARAARFVHLLLAGVLTGNEFGSWVGVHPALDSLPARHRLPAEQAVYRRYGRFMPVLMTATVAAAGPVLARTPRRSPAYGPTVASTACYAAMFAITLTGNIPLNRRLLALPDTADAHAELAHLRSRWDRLHSVRNVLNISGFALAAAAALRH